MNDMVEMVLIVENETAKAVLFKSEEDGEPFWLPKSQIATTADFIPGNTITVMVAEWIATKNGLI